MSSHFIILKETCACGGTFKVIVHPREVLHKNRDLAASVYCYEV